MREMFPITHQQKHLRAATNENRAENAVLQVTLTNLVSVNDVAVTLLSRLSLDCSV